MKKLLLLFILCFAAPAALGDNDGARGLSLPPPLKFSDFHRLTVEESRLKSRISKWKRAGQC